MEDIINALLDVVRAQHSATEGTDEAPFNMDDIVDMAMNLMGRPDEASEMEEMVSSIQKMVETMAPDIFPPKTFEELDDSEKVLSASNMIQNAFLRSNSDQSSMASSQREEAAPATAMSPYAEADYQEEEESSQNPGDLNDLIYKNFMEMMGLSTPQVEFPFDRSQIQYGKEKSITEQLAEEEEEKSRAAREEADRNRKLSAWELAQNAIDTDEAAHAKEPYVPKPVEQPKAKSASQMAAEAIRKSEEEDRMRLEIEKQAEAMMAEAKKRGQDPMKFMLHQQEILRYMEDNSDELVSFEDYEDLSPEEKLEIERGIHIQKQLEQGVSPDQLDEDVPEEYIPEELKSHVVSTAQASSEESEEATSTFDEDIMRALSQQVLSENAAMFQGENPEDMAAFQEELFANLRRAMGGAGTAVPMEDIGSLLEQAAANSLGESDEEAPAESTPVSSAPASPAAPATSAAAPEEAPAAPSLSAVELAMAAQIAAKPRQEEQERKTISAADLAKAVQAEAKKKPEEQKEVLPLEEEIEENDDLDMDFDDLDEAFEEETPEEAPAEASADQASPGARSEEEESGTETDSKAEQVNESEEESEPEADVENEDENPTVEAATEPAEEDDDEYEYVDPDELVLGEHTQAEVDEAIENLNTLGLQGEVYERAKRMLLLELAGSEAALDAWLFEQENSKKKKKANVSLIDEEGNDDLSDFDEDLFEKELEEAMEEDFVEEDTDDEASPSDESDDESDGESDDESDDGIGEEADDESSDESDDESDTESSDESSAESDDISDNGQETETIESIEVVEEKDIAKETVLEADTPKASVESTPENQTDRENSKEKKSKSHRGGKSRKTVIHKKEKSAEKKTEKKAESKEEAKNPAEERGYQVSVRKPFILKNSTSYIDKFADFITENQENRKLSTGFKKLDGMLRFGLHKGSYFIDAQPQYLKNSFMQQIADRAAEGGVDVLYISTELSRYDLMVDTISRLSYEMNGHDSDKAHSVMSIMTGEEGATLECLDDELNWFRGRISEHLFILDQEAVDEYIDSLDDLSANAILEELIRSIVREGAHKPVVFIDNIENILSAEDSEDMKPLMDGIRGLAKELSIPIIMSYGYAQAESEEELSVEEEEFHESLGNMCDVYLELQYADMITEDSVELTEEDIREMVEDGESLLVDVLLHRNRRPMRASCQIQVTPKFNFFEE